jgi:transporter family protein
MFWFLIAAVIVMWGIWGIAEKMALFKGNPWQTLFAFLSWSALVFTPTVAYFLYKFHGKLGFQINKWVWLWAFIAVASNGLAVIAFRYALLREGAGMVVALTAAYPIMTAILSTIFLKESLGWVGYFGIILTCFGVYLISLKS